MKSLFVVPLANRIILLFPHCRLPLQPFSAAWFLLHLQHLASRYMLSLMSVVDRGWTESSGSLHWFCIRPNSEKWQPKTFRRSTPVRPFVTGRDASHVYEKERGSHLVPIQMSNIALHRVSSISPSGIKVAWMRAFEFEYIDCEYFLQTYKCNRSNKQAEAAGHLLLCGYAQII